MKNILLILLVAVTLPACKWFGDTKPDKVQIVYVDRAVPSCPVPPTLPPIEYMSDKLEIVDVNQPGKVVKAIVYDNTQLRFRSNVCDLILNEYSKTVQDFSVAKEEINKMRPAPAQ